MRYYKIACRETTAGLNFRVVPALGWPGQGFKKLDGEIQSANLNDAAKTLKAILIKGTTAAGFVWKEK